jgi:predicted amino acid dehydrogenase
MEDEDTKEDSLVRFESRFGNIKDFKKKALEEHVKNCKNSDHCLECASAGIKQREIRDEDLRV